MIKLSDTSYYLLHKIILSLSLLLLIPITTTGRDREGRFVVVIDAGHGGHDSGAKGKISFEKNIVLAVAKKVGAEVEALNSRIKVYYTRKTDTFIGLDQRAEYAIGKHADLFVSIHANSAPSSSAYGSETYVLGLHRSKDNLAVAMKENSVILLEENYERKYENFDPRSSESYIIFQFMQNKHLDASILLARDIQNGFRSCGRHDRGVRQAGFLVLRKAAMPSVLVELGFISNPSEERYMNSPSGQSKLASQIARAIVQYEREITKRSGKPSTPSQAPTTNKTTREDPTKPKQVEKNDGRVATYRIQVLADVVKLPSSHALYRQYGKDNVRYYREGQYYKYTVFDTPSLEEAHEFRKELRKRYKDCFVVGFDSEGNKVGNYY